jgi:hypothetical protein
MPKTKSEPNKSQVIRDHLTENPKAKAKEIVSALGEKGVKITEGLVYAVKGAMAAKKGRKKRVMRAAKAALENERGNGFVKQDVLSLIVDVKAIAARAGGYDKLKDLVDALAR